MKNSLKTIFTIGEAAQFLSKDEPRPLSEEDVLDLVKQQRLPVCFECDSELFPAIIEHASSRIEAEKPIPIAGILRALTYPDSNKTLTASLVEIVRVDKQRLFRNGEGRTSLPTVTPYGGAIRPGFKVTGFLNFEGIPVQDWRFHLDDLFVLNSGGNNSSVNSSQIEVQPWIQNARTIGKDIAAKNKKLGVMQIAKKVYAEMKDRHARGESGMSGRGGKIPSPDTIKRHALTGLRE